MVPQRWERRSERQQVSRAQDGPRSLSGPGPLPLSSISKRMWAHKSAAGPLIANYLAVVSIADVVHRLFNQPTNQQAPTCFSFPNYKILCLLGKGAQKTSPQAKHHSIFTSYYFDLDLDGWLLPQHNFHCWITSITRWSCSLDNFYFYHKMNLITK